MWTLVNVGSHLMWTFHQEWNHLYIMCTKLLPLIWANIWLLWATQCQTPVETIRFTHVVHVYKFILAFALGETLSAHISSMAAYGSVICIADALFDEVSLQQLYRMPGCCMDCFRYFLIRDKSDCFCSCHVHVQYIYYCTYKSNCTYISIDPVLYFVHKLE